MPMLHCDIHATALPPHPPAFDAGREGARQRSSPDTARRLDSATLLFSTSFGYFDRYMLKMAAKYPKIQFRHCGGLWQKDKHPMNTGSYFGYIGMGQYLNGIASGYANKSKKIGFIAAKPIRRY